MKKFATALAVLAVGGCATIVRGTDEQVQFMSEPSGASVQTSIGLSCPITPCTIPIPRKHEFVATFHLPDHEPQNVAVATRLAGGGAAGVAGNLLFGGVVGMALDVSNGASMDHSPNPVTVQLEPLKPVSPLIERRPLRRRAVPDS